MRSLRFLRLRPGYAATAIGTLALGIGATVALFSVVHGVLLQPLAYPDSGRIVSLQARDGAAPAVRLSGPLALDARDSGAALWEDATAISLHRGGEMGVELRGRTVLAGVAMVNPGFFAVFGVRPAVGRFFANAQETAAVVSPGFAERHFGGAPAAMGQTLTIDHRVYEIAGVAEAALRYPANAQVWVPSRWPAPTESRNSYNYSVVARLRPGVAAAQVRQRLPAVEAVPLRDHIAGSARETLRLLAGAVAMVLLICCVNVAHLSLAQAAGRSREIAVRAALGAGRWRIVRQLAGESVVLGLLGGAGGLLVASVLLDALPYMAPAGMPRLDEVRISPVVFAFAAAVALVTSLLAGIAPVLDAAPENARQAVGASARASAWRSVLVVAEIALCFVLATGAMLLLKTYARLQQRDPGFAAEGVWVVYAHAPARTLQDHRDAGRRLEALSANLAATLPGVTAASAAMGVPAGRYNAAGMFAVEGHPQFAPGSGRRLPQAGFRLTSPGYFRAMGIPLRGGRDFNERDTDDQPFAAIVSQAWVKLVFPNGEDPIGRRIQCGLDAPDQWMTIVGVAGDVRQKSLASAPEPELYMPVRQHPFYSNELQLVIRGRGLDAGTLERQAAQLDARIAVKAVTLAQLVADSVAVPRFRATLVSAFALVALLLAVAGVYGVMSYTVARRTAEFGLRAALGATSQDLRRQVLGWALRRTMLGAAVGAAMSIGLARLFAAFLNAGVEPRDVPSLLGALAAVIAAALGAALVPAFRAARVDPIEALRQQ